jgi:acyl dehydratase
MTTPPPVALRASLPSGALDVLRYAAACGDFHALHHDPDSPEARAAGGRVLPGRYQHGAIARLLREQLGAELEQLECAYLAPAYVGQELWLEARVRPEANGQKRIRLKLLDAESRILLAGNACTTTSGTGVSTETRLK